MTKIAIVSDIHANIYGLEAILKDIAKRKNIDEIICMGDTIGYYPYPNECIDLVRENCSITMLGNHDAGVIGDEPSFCFNKMAYTMIEWTQKQIRKENKKWLTKLPRRRTIERDGKSIYLVHGSPIRVFDYLSGHENGTGELLISEAFEKTKTDCLIVGHTHKPIVKTVKKKLFINPGSTGQPRNGIPGAFYAILNTNRMKAEIVHLKYDFSELQKKMKKLNLPIELADRLNHGI